MNGGVRLGSVRGVEVVADASAAVLALLFGAAVFVDLLTSDFVGSNERALALATVAGILIVVSVFAHEVAHAVVGTIKGQKVLGIRLFMFGGYSVIEGKPTPMTEFQVALAGPASSVLLGLVFWLVAMVVPSEDIAAGALALAFANVAIGLFNLFPGFPLDGGRVLRGLIAARGGDPIAATHLVAMVGRYTGWVVMVVGVGLVARTEPAGLFWIVAGWFLATTALQTGRREELAQTFAGQTARTVMRRIESAVPGSMDISTMVDLYALGPDLRSQPVEVEGKVVGVIGQDELDSASPARWVSTAVERMMTRIGPSDVVVADEPLENLLIRPAGGAGRIVVVEDGTVIGIIEPRDLGSRMSYS
jgi:Zn-dependent protease